MLIFPVQLLATTALLYLMAGRWVVRWEDLLLLSANTVEGGRCPAPSCPVQHSAGVRAACSALPAQGWRKDHGRAPRFQHDILVRKLRGS